MRRMQYWNGGDGRNAMLLCAPTVEAALSVALEAGLHLTAGNLRSHWSKMWGTKAQDQLGSQTEGGAWLEYGGRFWKLVVGPPKEKWIETKQKKPTGKFTVRQLQIMNRIKPGGGWELGSSHERITIQKGGIGHGGESERVSVSTFSALVQRGAIEVKKQGFPSTTYKLSKSGKSAIK